MEGLADEGFVVVGGPLGDGVRTLLTVDADSEADIRTRLEADPWTPMDLLHIDAIEPWQIRLGTLRVS